MGVTVKAYAKLNFTLDITGASDGFHMLDSLVCTVDLYDTVKVKKRRDKLVNIVMHGCGTETLPYEHNNAAKAAESFINAFGTCGADITIYKNIPVGGGLGGSSADVAGVLNAMSRLYGVGSERQIKELADELGSDTGYLLSGGWARLTGRGERVQSLDIKTKLYILLLLPQSGVSTAECYRVCDGLQGSLPRTADALSALLKEDLTAFGGSLGNALYPAATQLNPDVEKAFSELEDFAPLGVNMTGSGSGVFAIFPTRELRDWAKSRYGGKFRQIELKTQIF
ncbi:MAG: 4-(cytidine 5'-diphospho)-2-C-methyl-D-erythritol kinase [Clostridia bacterium]|nr:4-(cytidine 5'-diphospho)-2-C-methyl-D-erythritol kinase [Clostridia bacterium]